MIVCVFVVCGGVWVCNWWLCVMVVYCVFVVCWLSLGGVVDLFVMSVFVDVFEVEWDV